MDGTFNIKEQVSALVRHGFTVGGGYLTAQGMVPGSEVDLLIGGAMALFGLAWSSVRKIRNKPRAE